MRASLTGKTDPYAEIKPTRRRLLAGVVAGVVLAAGKRTAVGGEAVSPRRAVRFDVLRGGELIGYHLVEFADAGDGLAVRTDIEIEVRILGIRAFVFRHQSVERWTMDRLQSFDSETVDNDSQFFVRGRAVGDRFQITHRKGKEVAPADIMVASYWRPAIARQTRLIDPQRGRVKDQQLLRRDRIVVPVGDRDLPADQYRLNGVVDGWVAYGDDGDWLAAELKKGGSDILYRRRS